MVVCKSGKSGRITLWDTEKDRKVSAKATDQFRTEASQAIARAYPPKVGIYKVAVQP